jgi:hypothetical protein
MPSQCKSDTARLADALPRSSFHPVDAFERNYGRILLKCEDPSELRKWISLYTAAYQPTGFIEEQLVGDMISHRWRIERYRRIESVLKSEEFARESQRALSLLKRLQFTLRRFHEYAFKTLLERQNKQNPDIRRPHPQLALDLRNCKVDPRRRYPIV